MDSVSQFALGAAVSVAVMGRRTAVWKAALAGGVAGTLPDLDAVIRYGDPILNMVRHRAESHSLLYLSLLAPLLGWGISRLSSDLGLLRRWTLALWLALFTHPLLDLMTVYGTRLLIPFTDYPYGIGSIFIIDPLYTLPLLLGLGVALASKTVRGLTWNKIGLAVSTMYLLWGVGAQSYVTRLAQTSLKDSGIESERLLVNPTAFNSILWRFVAITPDDYYEGFWSLLDDSKKITWRQYPRCGGLAQRYATKPGMAAIAHFSHGFYSVSQTNGHVFVTDLRMGQEPYYFFRFDLGPQADAVTPGSAGQRPRLETALPWLWTRLWGTDVALPETRETLRPLPLRIAERCGDQASSIPNARSKH